MWYITKTYTETNGTEHGPDKKSPMYMDTVFMSKVTLLSTKNSFFKNATTQHNTTRKKELDL